jgi:UDP:flavonoid glycosyltransferase YjiC (YdhE family)
MSTFLFASIPVPAHTTNPMPIGARLVERGHTVLWYAGSVFHERLAVTGARPLPYRTATDFGGRDLEQVYPWLRDLGPLRTLRRGFAEIFVGQAPARIADLERILAEQARAGAPVDAVLSDGLMVGVGMLAERGGPPWATFGDGPLGFTEPDTPPFGPGLLPMSGPVGRLRNRLVTASAGRLIFGDATRVRDRIRAEHGLPATTRPVTDELFSPFLHLQACTPGFEYPRHALPPHVHWIGALRPYPRADWSRPAWWSEVEQGRRPVVHLSQGSIRPDMTELVLPTIRGLADEDVLVVVTTGGPTRADLESVYGGPLPANVRVAGFIPYDELLAHADVFVTNGGYTGVTLALAHGVPLVQAGRTEEKAEIAARIHWSGVGVRLSGRPGPDAVRRGVHRVLTEPGFAAAAGRLRDESAQHDAGLESALLLEQLATTGRPVTRAVGLRA